MVDTAKSNDVPFWGARARVVIPGLVAWLITVAEPARQLGAPTTARVVGVLAVLLLFAGAAIVTTRPVLGRVLALHGFVVSSLFAWAWLDSELSPDRLDRGRALLGALAWMLYAFGWGQARAPWPRSADTDGGGPLLMPRSRLPRASLVVALIALFSALLLSALAFRTDRPEHALFSHAAATACGLLLLATGGRIALAQGQRFDLSSDSQRLDAASVPGALIGVLLGLGLVWAALR
jgi:hypothetical protein